MEEEEENQKIAGPQNEGLNDEEQPNEKEQTDLCAEFSSLEESDAKKKKERTIQELQSQAEKSETDKPDSEKSKSMPLVLEPDHPIMERFQTALKNHLLKQLDRLNNQVLDLDNEVKVKEKEKEETGIELYSLQQEIYRQQKTLEDIESAIENLMKERQAMDESLRSKKMSWKEEVNCLNTAKKKESDMMIEFQKLSSLEKQMEKWEKEMESELTVTQRISEKTQYDKYKMIEEKRKMDMYLLKLMAAVSNYESELKLLDGEIDVKLEEKDLLNQTLADATADLQCLVAEQKRLFSAWNSIVCTINQKNLVYTDISKELTKCQEGFLSLNAEIQSYKRSSAEEMKKSEKLSIIVTRLQNDLETSTLSFQNLIQTKEILEEKLSSTASIINRTAADFDCYKIDTEKQEAVLTSLSKSLNLIYQEKQRYEDEVSTYLQDHITKDKMIMHLSKCLKVEREKSRKQEFSLIEAENKISQKFLEVEELKEIIARNNEIINEMNNELNSKNDELKKLNDEISKFQTAIIQKQGNYAILLRKIEKYSEMTPSEKPLQQRVTKLEKSNAEIQEKNDKLQSFWLIQQNNNVKLTQQRNEQLKNISLLRRQVFILQQKGLKIDTEIEREKKIENDINKLINQLQHKLSVLNETLAGKKGYRENLDKENALTQAYYLQNLKDAELEQIRLKDEVNELERNLEELAEAMLATQREILAWEKKIQMAVETRNNMQKERTGDGEITQMKSEIHRMEVRYGQLKKVQEKLITDLEQCVLRRDAIFEGADAMEKRQEGNRNFNTRFKIQQKIGVVRNNIRTVCNESKQLEKTIENCKEGHEELKKVILEKETQLLQMQETMKEMDEQLDERKLKKCQNLEMLIRRQKKCKLYELVKNGRHRLLFKSEGVLEKELQKVKGINADLISIVEALAENFPDYRLQLKKIYNSLQAKPS